MIVAIVSVVDGLGAVISANWLFLRFILREYTQKNIRRISI